MKRALAYALLLGCVIWIIFVIHINVDAIAGAYGSGPPYYDRTTNMDKWESPILMLIALDLVSLAVVFLAGRWAYVRVKQLGAEQLGSDPD